LNITVTFAVCMEFKLIDCSTKINDFVVELEFFVSINIIGKFVNEFSFLSIIICFEPNSDIVGKRILLWLFVGIKISKSIKKNNLFKNEIFIFHKPRFLKSILNDAQDVNDIVSKALKRQLDDPSSVS
jgi:hypothetical protein